MAYQSYSGERPKAVRMKAAQGENDRYLNRELSWIEFNRRVLAQAENPGNPLLERLKFLGIVSANFDEFFMSRIAGLSRSDDYYVKIYLHALAAMDEQKRVWHNQILPELEGANIRRIKPEMLSERQSEKVYRLFFHELIMLLTPIALKEGKKLPAFVNLSTYVTVTLLNKNKPEERELAIVEIPKNYPRMISLPSDGTFDYILLEDIIATYVEELFRGYEVVERGLIRLTRAADLSLEEGQDEDFAQVMTEALRERRKSYIVRAEICASDELKAALQRLLNIEDHLIYRSDNWIDFKSLSALAFQSSFPELKNKKWTPLLPLEFEKPEEIWDVIKEKDRLISMPYESFGAFTQFLSAAADDPDVLAIKQTLYRTASESSVIASLERAAQNGKQVTVLVELKARFDEEANIAWARRLELSGATVIYGIAGFKTHAKACLIVRREVEGIQRYIHLSTGNYNEKTSKVYSDIAIFTANDALANDITAFFNLITGFSQPVGFSKIKIAPYDLRGHLLRLIEREITHAEANHNAFIKAKMNSLVDKEIIDALYAAASKGVKIYLNIRGICCLDPGLPELNNNIKVTSIIDMFLEHARIFQFSNSGNDEVYLSSSDWMPRNFDRRLELMFPVIDENIRKYLIRLLADYFKDNVSAWELKQGGVYQKVVHQDEKPFWAQEYLCRKSIERQKIAAPSPGQELRPQRPKKQKK